MRWNYLFGLSLFCFSQVQAFQFPDQNVSAYECYDACPDLPRQAIHREWAIADHSLRHQKPPLQKSYSYQKKVTQAELQAGVELNTLAPGAVVRISSLSGKPIPPLQIKTRDDNILSLMDASSLSSQNQPFGDPSLNSQPQTVLQLKEELGAGPLQLLTSEQDVNKDELYLVSVFDKYSSVYMTVETSKPEYKINEQLVATITLNDLIDYPIDSVDAYIKTPKGDKYPLSLTKISNNQYEGRAFLTSNKNDLGENWYIDAEMKVWLGNQTVTRVGHTAFSYIIPSAKLINIQKSTDNPLEYTATLNIAQPSRYALQTVLYYKDGQGRLHPLSTSQSAQWFEPGINQLHFKLDKGTATQYDPSSLYIGYFHLIDYGQLKNVYDYDTPIRLSDLG